MVKVSFITLRLVVSPFSSFREQEVRSELEQKYRENRSFDTFITCYFFSSGSKTTHLQMEFAYCGRLSQSHTKAVSQRCLVETDIIKAVLCPRHSSVYTSVNTEKEDMSV